MAEPLPQYTGIVSSAMCHLLPRPLLMTGFFRDHLVRHFQARTIEDNALRHLVWKNDTGTNILIESIHRWRPALTEHRPAVVIKRNAYSNRRVGIGDKSQLNPADRQGNPHYSTFWMGSHTLFCIGSSGAQTELLASEVQRELTEFGPLFLRTMALHRFQVMEVGEVAELEEATENFVVPVTVAYAFEQRWVLLQQAPRLSSVSLSLILDF